MGVSIAFEVTSVGVPAVKALSLGDLYVGINRDGVLEIYEWWGTGSAEGVTACRDAGSVYIPAKNLPLDLNHKVVGFAIDGGQVVGGLCQM